MLNVIALAMGGSVNNRGVYQSTNSSSTIDQSTAVGSTAAMEIFDSGSSTNIAHSHLEGAVTNTAGGSATCLGVTDASAFYANTCP